MRTCPHFHLPSSRREFQSVLQQVGKNVLHPETIEGDLRQPRSERKLKLGAALRVKALPTLERIFYALINVPKFFFYFEPSRFQRAEIQEVFYEAL
jgi:hypothetical protein